MVKLEGVEVGIILVINIIHHALRGGFVLEAAGVFGVLRLVVLVVGVWWLLRGGVVIQVQVVEFLHVEEVKIAVVVAHTEIKHHHIPHLDVFDGMIGGDLETVHLRPKRSREGTQRICGHGSHTNHLELIREIREEPTARGDCCFGGEGMHIFTHHHSCGCGCCGEKGLARGDVLKDCQVLRVVVVGVGVVVGEIFFQHRAIWAERDGAALI